MVRHTNTEITVIKETGFYPHRCLETGGIGTSWGHTGEAPGSVSTEGVRGKYGQNPLLWFLWEGVGEAVWAGLGLAGLNSFSGFWDIGTVPSCLTPGLGVGGAGGEHLEVGEFYTGSDWQRGRCNGWFACERPAPRDVV